MTGVNLQNICSSNLCLAKLQIIFKLYSCVHWKLFQKSHDYWNNGSVSILKNVLYLLHKKAPAFQCTPHIHPILAKNKLKKITFDGLRTNNSPLCQAFSKRELNLNLVRGLTEFLILLLDRHITSNKIKTTAYYIYFLLGTRPLSFHNLHVHSFFYVAKPYMQLMQNPSKRWYETQIMHRNKGFPLKKRQDMCEGW